MMRAASAAQVVGARLAAAAISVVRLVGFYHVGQAGVHFHAQPSSADGVLGVLFDLLHDVFVEFAIAS
jgi:hypothetical protein